MEYRQLGRTGTRVLGAVPRHHDLRQRGRRGDQPADRRPVRRRRWQLHRHGERVQPGRLRGDHRASSSPTSATRSWWPRRHASRWAATPTRWARHVATCAPRARRRSAGSAPNGSTSTRCTCGTGTRRSKRRCRPSTTSCERARSATSVPATSPAGTWPRPSASARCMTGSRSSACSPSTRSSPATPSVSSSRCVRARVSPSSRGARSAAASSRASTRKGADFPSGTRGGDTENPITFTYRLDDRAWSIVDAVKDAAEQDRQERRADLAELGAQPARRDRTDHRRPQPDPARGQPRRGRLASSTTRPARPSSWASAFRLGYPYEFIQYAG